TVILYALAMLAYACDFAFSKSRVMRDVAVAVPGQSAAPAASASAAAEVAEPAVVGAAAGRASTTAMAAGGTVTLPAGRGGQDGGPGEGGARPAQPLPDRESMWPAGMWLRTAFALACIGLTTHVLALLTRGIAEHRVPWGNMYEFIAAITC